MKTIDETEENKIFQVINDALFALCEEKPNNPIDFLSKKMFELIGEKSDLMAKKRISTMKFIKNMDEKLITKGQQ